MSRNHRITTLIKWGEVIKSTDWTQHYKKIEQSNPWFTEENIELSISGISRYLDSSNLKVWLENYPEITGRPKTIGVIMAGNLPLVGLHDLLCVYTSGHQAMVKLSRQDKVLLPLMFEKLIEIEPQAKSYITLTDNIDSNIDAIIATGSDNTSRYIKYYFGNVRSIIRSNRVSIAVVKGNETKDQLAALGDDIFSYFGKGCRNVSKLLVPTDYDFWDLISSNRRFETLLDHPKYLNNYRYYLSLYKTLGTDCLNSGYSLVFRSDSLVSPLSVIYFDTYQNTDQVKDYLKLNINKIQCVGAADGWYEKSNLFGTLQSPDLWDYADNIDTMEFLLNL